MVGWLLLLVGVCVVGPIRRSPIWIPIAGFLVVLNGFMIVIGFTHPQLIGYGGSTEQLISLSVIAVGLISYFFARVVQDHGRGRELWRVRPERDASPPPGPVDIKRAT